MRSSPILAAIAVLGLGAPLAEAGQLAQATAGAAARAGVAAAVRGEVKLAALPGVREVGKDVASGDPIFLGDQVTTGAEGRLQIMLADETVFTIGPNAAMVIDHFVYDPATNAGKVTASVLKGTFRFVTGKVAKREPSDMEVKLPVGSIGVRGTSVAGETDGTRATIVLLGPGPETNTGERVGRILVTGTGATGAATTVEIVRPGFGTEIAGANLAPSAAVRIDPGRIAAITAPLAGTAPRPTTPSAAPPGPAQPGASPVQAASPQPASPVPGATPTQAGAAPQGQPAPGNAGGGITFTQAPINPTGGLAGIRTVGALAPAGQQAIRTAATAAQTPAPLGSQTTYEQLRSISSGTAEFGSQTRPIEGAGTGTYTITYRYDFGSRTATGNIAISESTGFTAGNGTSGNFALLQNNPFSTKTGPVAQTESGSVGGAGGNITVEYRFRNDSNTIFKTLVHKVTYVDGVTGTGQGEKSR